MCHLLRLFVGLHETLKMCLFVASICLLLFRMPSKKAQLQVVASQQAAKLAEVQAAKSAEVQAAKSAEVQAAKSAEVQAAKSAEVPPPSSPQTSTAKSPAQSPGPSPGRATRNSNKPTYVGSTEATTEMASKKRKTDQSATDYVGSSSSATGRVRNKVNRLGDFEQHLDESDGEEKDDEDEEKDDEDDDDDEADDAQEVEVRSQPLTPSRSLEMPIIQLLKKGRQIKSVSPIGDPYPDPNFP